MRWSLLHCPLLLLFLGCVDACMRVNPPSPGMPAVPCKSCAKNLIMVTTGGATSKPMESDVTSTTGACAVRTFTCKGTQASIEVFTPEGSQGNIEDGGTGTATFAVTCNADGTKWEAMNMEIKRVECGAVPACRTCTLEQIMKTMVGAGSKAFADDQLMFPADAAGCVTRTFTCTGTMANIAVSGANGLIQNVGDGGTGTSTYTVTCNADGSGWTKDGATVTSVECSAAAANPCATGCATGIEIKLDAANPASSQMDRAIPGMNAAGCKTISYLCTAPVNPVIAINSGAVSQTDAADGMTDGMASLVATCNAAGTAWEANGVAVTDVECTIPCQKCSAAEIALTTSNSGMLTSTPAMISHTGSCAAWTIMCTGPKTPTIGINNGAGDWSDGPGGDGTPDGTVTIPMTCNNDGTGWMGTTAPLNVPLTAMDCSALA